MNKVVLLLGSNLGDSQLLFSRAMDLLKDRVGAVGETSSLYESTPWGFVHENDFLNQVAVVQTALAPLQILKECLQIETDLGRERKGQGYVARTIDIDLLFVDDVVMKTKDLTLPHPRLQLRRFTLLPLIELMSNFVHPELNKTMRVLLQDCEDHSEVRKL
jgi:2-amino-4-hydroxy-6-hydroxymethyldihydropteridine diphosphokinase